MGQKRANQDRDQFYVKRKFYKISLNDLQKYFNDHIFYFEESHDHEDENEALTRTYEEQALAFLRRIGAMLSVDAFLTIGNDMVYVRQLPPERLSLQGER